MALRIISRCVPATEATAPLFGDIVVIQILVFFIPIFIYILFATYYAVRIFSTVLFIGKIRGHVDRLAYNAI
jgi:hypothetical protein